MKKLIVLGIFMIAATACSAANVVENSREIPVAYDVDVVVVGGSTRAVAAAVAAKESGASVFLAAQRPYLGEDMCATYRLWLEEGETPTTLMAKTIYQKGTPTPLRVKRTLDDALLKAGVEFLYGCYPTDVLRDNKGRLAGIVMANRSGRQAIRAKVIIDATERGILARIAGASFSPYPTGPQKFTRIVLGGEPNEGAKLLPVEFTINSDSRRHGGQKTYKVYEYTFDVPMKDGSWQSFSRANRLMRDRTWQDGQAVGAENIFQVPPDPVKSRKAQKGTWTGVAKLNLDALRPVELGGVYVLGGCADVTRQAARRIMRPVNGIELGMRVGEAAAKDARVRKIASVDKLVVSGKSGGRDVGRIGEMLNGLRSRPGLKEASTVKSPVRGLEVFGEYDVIVVGGGTGGSPAGISAGRAGAKTLVIEYLNGLGGVGTLGRISNYYHGNRVGFTCEIDKANGRGSWNIEKKMEWYRKEILKAGGDIWFQSLACGAVIQNNRFVGVVVATPFGRGVVLARTVIDSTGNSVIPASAGLPCQEIGADHISIQGTGLPTFAPGVGYLNGDWSFNDDSDVVDMWRMFVVGKHKVGKGKASYQNAFDLGQLINTRARRRIIGDVVITPMDIINERTYPDTITVSKSNFDNHGFSSHDLFMIISPRSRIGNVPYRALMPKGYDGLLVTGLGISAHGDSMPVLRMQADVQNQGYAAGYAAALASRNKTTVRKIDVKTLQKHLVEKGVIPETRLTAKDSYPISDKAMKEAVEHVGNGYKGISMALTDIPRALPLLRQAYKSAAEKDTKLCYAHVLGMLGDNTGTETLIERLNDAEWDKGWNFRGMGQYGPTTSYTDNLVIALGRTRDNRGLDCLLDMLAKLTNKSEFSHCRAAAMALESVRDKRAAKPLAEFLRKEGMTGYAFTDIRDAIERTPGKWGDTSTRNTSLRELILARALYRCGDHQGLGEKILKTYAKDLRGHYAAHAKAILNERTKFIDIHIHAHDCKVVKDLITPLMTNEKPAAGKRVRQVTPEYKGTDVYHSLYLPVDWKKGGKYPVIVEYTGNKAKFCNSTGEVKDANLGYGMSGGKGFIWVSMPYIQKGRKENTVKWWGDRQATINYCKVNIPRICKEFGGDPDNMFICGFSRGAIGASYIGLADDEIASLWKGMFTHDYFDGGSYSDRKTAPGRLRRLKGRPVLACGIGTDYPKAHRDLARFTFLDVPVAEIFDIPEGKVINAHTDMWMHRESAYRRQARAWLRDVLKGKGAASDIQCYMGNPSQVLYSKRKAILE